MICGQSRAVFLPDPGSVFQSSVPACIQSMKGTPGHQRNGLSSPGPEQFRGEATIKLQWCMGGTLRNFALKISAVSPG
jgi:hypothetical protein